MNKLIRGWTHSLVWRKHLNYPHGLCEILTSESSKIKVKQKQIWQQWIRSFLFLACKGVFRVHPFWGTSELQDQREHVDRRLGETFHTWFLLRFGPFGIKLFPGYTGRLSQGLSVCWMTSSTRAVAKAKTSLLLICHELKSWCAGLIVGCVGTCSRVGKPHANLSCLTRLPSSLGRNVSWLARLNQMPSHVLMHSVFPGSKQAYSDFMAICFFEDLGTDQKNYMEKRGKGMRCKHLQTANVKLWDILVKESHSERKKRYSLLALGNKYFK